MSRLIKPSHRNPCRTSLGETRYGSFQKLREPFVVGVQKGQQLPLGLSDSTISSSPRPRIRLTNHAKSPIRALQKQFCALRTGVRGPIIHDNDFKVLEGLRTNGFERPRDRGSLIVKRDDDRTFHSDTSLSKRFFRMTAATRETRFRNTISCRASARYARSGTRGVLNTPPTTALLRRLVAWSWTTTCPLPNGIRW